MKILADENIPLVKEILADCGEVTTISGREITPNSLKGFDILLVRSITKVNETLLKGSTIKFVGTATTGTDHIDVSYLKEKGITFADAAGSNANSVVEYITALLLHISVQSGISLSGKSIGIVGVGRIGSNIAKVAKALDMNVLKNDPLVEESGVKDNWKKLEELYDCDFLTIHTPLTKTGKHPTYHLFNEENLKKINNKTVFINASRGEVVDNQALLKVAYQNNINKLALDTWEEEPFINMNLLSKTYHATPHIAGYSYDGKVNGTIMMLNALSESFKLKPKTDPESFRPQVKNPQISIDNNNKKDEEVLLEAITQAYDFRSDHERMRSLLAAKTTVEQGKKFDILRKEYPLRREFSNYSVSLTQAQPGLLKKLESLGFKNVN